MVWTTAADTVTVESYENTVSAANTARDAAAKANGAKPVVMINWWHSDMKHINVGPKVYMDAREDLPSWVDAVANT